MRPSDFTAKILAWYAENGRHLPWRNNSDPYTIWVSEIMLQQTRVETVIPYYERWMAHFPTIKILAEASQQEVLSIWEGLGYYSRARNLHLSAQIVMKEMGGEIPKDIQLLLQLPGIGRYTAGAIASIAFGKDEPVLDGNIRRLFSRIFNVTQPARSPEGERILWELVTEHLPVGKASEYNQALMDLGSMVCIPRQPNCPMCPIIDSCQAYTLGVQTMRPVTKTKPKIPHHVVTAAVIKCKNKVLIAQRPPDGLLGGLWEFPGGKLKNGENLQECLRREIQEELGVNIQVGSQLGKYRHAYTHFRVTLYAFSCTLKNGKKPEPIQVHDIRWITTSQLSQYPMGKIDRQIAEQLFSMEDSR